MLTSGNHMQTINEKLHNNNFQAWKFRITIFLKEKGYWIFIEGANKEAPTCPPRNATLE